MIDVIRLIFFSQVCGEVPIYQHCRKISLTMSRSRYAANSNGFKCSTHSLMSLSTSQGLTRDLTVINTFLYEWGVIKIFDCLAVIVIGCLGYSSWSCELDWEFRVQARLAKKNLTHVTFPGVLLILAKVSDPGDYLDIGIKVWNFRNLWQITSVT